MPFLTPDEPKQYDDLVEIKNDDAPVEAEQPNQWLLLLSIIASTSAIVTFCLYWYPNAPPLSVDYPQMYFTDAEFLDFLESSYDYYYHAYEESSVY